MKKRLVICLTILVLLTTPLFSQWSFDPAVNNAVCNLSGAQAIPKVATSEDLTYISWFSNDSNNYDVRLQSYDPNGYQLWEDNGIVISDNEAMTWLTEWDMTIDSENHAILAFQDIRTGNNNIYAYRISPEGEFVWGEDGLTLSNTTAFDASPVVAVTSEGNAIIAWTSETCSYMQKISPEGELLWGDTGIALTGAETYSWPQIIPIENDNILIKFYKDTGSFPYLNRDIYAQRYDTDGNAVWNDDTVISNAGGISAWTQTLSILKDDENGFYIAWNDDRDNNMISEVYVQHIESDGNCTYTDNGIRVSTVPNRNRMYTYLALPENSENLFAFWNEMDSNQNDRGIYGQKISPSGQRLWGDGAIAFIELSSTNVYPFAAGSSQENSVLFYEETTSGINSQILAMCIDEDGNFVWAEEQVTMCSINSEKIHPDVSNLQMNQWIATWEDSRNGNSDIYAQNISIDGNLGPQFALDDVPQNSLFKLYGSNPNPFQNQTKIKFSIESPTQVKIEIFNILGQKIRTLIDANFEKGIYSRSWNGKDGSNTPVSSGIYFVKLVESGNPANLSVKKIICIK